MSKKTRAKTPKTKTSKSPSPKKKDFTSISIDLPKSLLAEAKKSNQIVFLVAGLNPKSLDGKCATHLVAPETAESILEKILMQRQVFIDFRSLSEAEREVDPFVQAANLLSKD